MEQELCLGHISVGTTVCTSSCTKYPSIVEWVHQWVFSIYCTGFPSVFPSGALWLSAMLLCGWEMRRRLNNRNNPKGSRSVQMSRAWRKVLTFGTHFRATVWLKTAQLVWQASPLVSPTEVPKVSQTSVEKVLRQVVVQKVTSIPSIAALFHLISSFCCAGASSSSSGSSRRVSPGRAAGPGHLAPSSPACGAAWTSSAHGESAPSPPETQKHKTVTTWHSFSIWSPLSHKSLQNKSFNESDCYLPI